MARGCSTHVCFNGRKKCALDGKLKTLHFHSMRYAPLYGELKYTIFSRLVVMCADVLVLVDRQTLKGNFFSFLFRLLGYCVV